MLEGSIRVQFESTRAGMTLGIVLRICLGVGYFMDSAFRADERIYDEDFFFINLRDHSGDPCGDDCELARYASWSMSRITGSLGWPREKARVCALEFGS